MSKRERQILTGVGVALLLYYLFKQKPKWFTALYQGSNEATPTSADDYAMVGGSAFTPTGSDGTGDLISDPNSDASSDGGGVMESFDSTTRSNVSEYYDPKRKKKKRKGSVFRSGGGGEADSDDALIVNGGIRGRNRTIAPVSVLR